jgi:hypothetical protein
MDYAMVIADPAKNITVFVLDPVPPASCVLSLVVKPVKKGYIQVIGEEHGNKG